MQLKLKGLTLKGKNRVKENGEVWRVEIDGSFQGIPAWLVSCGKDKRWVFKENDPDFEIIELAPLNF